MWHAIATCALILSSPAERMLLPVDWKWVVRTLRVQGRPAECTQNVHRKKVSGFPKTWIFLGKIIGFGKMDTLSDALLRAFRRPALYPLWNGQSCGCQTCHRDVYIQ
jgi:hypothetical protein